MYRLDGLLAHFTADFFFCWLLRAVDWRLWLHCNGLFIGKSNAYSDILAADCRHYRATVSLSRSCFCRFMSSFKLVFLVAMGWLFSFSFEKVLLYWWVGCNFTVRHIGVPSRLDCLLPVELCKLLSDRYFRSRCSSISSSSHWLKFPSAAGLYFLR